MWTSLRSIAFVTQVHFFLFASTLSISSSNCAAFWGVRPNGISKNQRMDYHCYWSKKNRENQCNTVMKTTETGVDSDSLFVERFQRRRNQVQNRIDYERTQRPPNPELDPQQTVTKLIQGLSSPHEPIRNFGMTVLLESSTKEWLRVMSKSVGLTINNDNDIDDVTAGALYRAMSRPNQQFQILVGKEDKNFWVDFPTDVVQMDDGECWIECRLRAKNTDELLVVLGWTLRQKEDDSAWLVHNIDWQDFRDSYRPGIGREEWER
eukprot:CAMPEP_0178933176 /NCGR_PEP_ID=MMETSP0786-20121207/23103_1 /TAXON_ID=186022 /ORGANISM="Thalassionema frauenfeldii, Strain CCMP 1798" /LENGTH=263 /DNA_ID=CAMNT_0020610701 /DNA_START=46 /DNA_END=833 /DNA_ORIENTATION=-